MRFCGFLARPHLATATRQPARCKQEQHRQGAAKTYNRTRRALTQKVNVLNPANTNEYGVFQTVSSGQLRFPGSTDNGWYFDFLDSGERNNTDPQLGLGTLAFNTNIPSTSACAIGGFSNRYYIDYRTGGSVSTANTADGGLVSTSLGNALATRPVLVRLPNNTVVALSSLSDGTTMTSQVPIPGTSVVRRASWRELIN